VPIDVGAHITIDGGNGVSTVITDGSGAYSKSYMMQFIACTMPVKVHYDGDSNHSPECGHTGHDPASATALYHLERLSGPCPT
jgi:hypothetical protein